MGFEHPILPCKANALTDCATAAVDLHVFLCKNDKNKRLVYYLRIISIATMIYTSISRVGAVKLYIPRSSL